jgi:hypothetical protein
MRRGLSDGVLRQCYDHFNATSPLSQPAYSPIALAVAQHVGDIDFDLARGGTIAGHITDGYSSESFSGLNMGFRIYAEDGEYLDTIDLTTDEAGTYELPGIPSGSLFLLVSATRPALAARSSIPASTVRMETAASRRTGMIFSQGNTRVGVDFSFSPKASGAGVVRDRNSGSPLGGVEVTACLLSARPGRKR